MTWLAIVLPFVLLGIGVIFVAFSGGPSKAREAYLTRGSGAFRVVVPLLYIVLGIAVPAAVLVAREENSGAVGQLRAQKLSAKEDEGKQLFRDRCWSCHDLDAIGARGVTGPDLDELGEVTPQRIVGAIKNGGTGQGRMPADLLQGEDAENVALYVSKVAGKGN